MRSPLGQIVGFAEMLLEEAERAGAGPLLEPLRFIQRRANEALLTLNHSLAPHAGQFSAEDLQQLSHKLQQTAVSIRETVEGIVKICASGSSDLFSEDLQRISGAAAELHRLAGTELLALTATSAMVPEVEAASSEPAAIGIPPESGADFKAEAPFVILVVDDSAENREIIRRRLAPMGYELRLAADGNTALELIAATAVDLLLLDILMPGLDGIEVLKRLKANPTTQNIPVVMLSAIDDMESVVRCIELGADDYLPKPFPAPLLKARIKSCLANKRLSDQLRRYTEWLFGPTLFRQAVASPHSLSLKQHERAVMFADIRGFTRWTERHSAEQTVRMLNDYFEAAERILAGSAVIKNEYTGDEIMSVFPDVGSAWAMALRFQAELGSLLARIGLGIGLGVHCGPVIEGLVGSADVKAYSFVGDTINTARRICDHAHRGEILISKSAARAAGLRVEALPARSFKAKGKQDLLEVVGIPAPRSQGAAALSLDSARAALD